MCIEKTHFKGIEKVPKKKEKVPIELTNNKIILFFSSL